MGPEAVDSLRIGALVGLSSCDDSGDDSSDESDEAICVKSGVGGVGGETEAFEEVEDAGWSVAVDSICLARLVFMWNASVG